MLLNGVKNYSTERSEVCSTVLTFSLLSLAPRAY